MNEPLRLREQPQSDIERALLDAGRSYRTSPQTRAKVLAALGLAGSTTLGAAAVSASAVASTGVGVAGGTVGEVIGSSSGATSSLGSLARFGTTFGTKVAVKTSLAKVVLGVSLFGTLAAVPVGVTVWRRHQATASDVGRTTTRAPALAPAAALAPAVEPPAPAVAVGVGDLAPNSGAGIPVSAPVLRRELAALDAARLALARGDARAAFASLDAYARDYPHGRLQLEAEVLRIDALAKVGQRAAARKHAEVFVRRHPGSVFAQRVRGYLNN